MAETTGKQPQLALRSSDNEEILVDRDVAERSLLIKNMVNDLGEEAMTEAIPIPNVNAAVLKKVIEWCTHHRADPPAPADDDSDSRKKNADIEEWDQKFMQVDQETLFEIILAANYLDIKQLLDVGCKTVANMIKGKSPEEIRKTFNIQNDFTPEEEDQIRRENEWAEEPYGKRVWSPTRNFDADTNVVDHVELLPMYTGTKHQQTLRGVKNIGRLYEG